jgi:glycine amidinotransferase
MTLSIDKANLISTKPVVNSHNEWNTLEEVIVGIVDNAMFPFWNTINQWTVPPGAWDEIEEVVGEGGVPLSIRV